MRQGQKGKAKDIRRNGDGTVNRDFFDGLTIMSHQKKILPTDTARAFARTGEYRAIALRASNNFCVPSV